MNKPSIQFVAIVGGITIATIFICVAILFSNGTSQSLNFDNNQNLLVVTGDGEVPIVPDTANISLTITTLLTEGAKESQEKNDEVKSWVVGGLVANGVTEDHIKSQGYQLNREYLYRGVQKDFKDFQGWKTEHRLTVQVPFENVEEVLRHALVGDEVSVGFISLETNNTEEAAKQARQLAIEDAKQKAQEIAEMSGVQLGDIYDISEGKQRQTVLPAAMEYGGGGGGLERGSGELHTYMTVAFEIRKK